MTYLVSTPGGGAHPPCIECGEKPSRNKGRGRCEACYRWQLRSRKQGGNAKPRKRYKPRQAKKDNTPPPLGTPNPLQCSPPEESLTECDIVGTQNHGELFAGGGGLLATTRRALDGVEGEPWKVETALLLAVQIDRAHEAGKVPVPAALVAQYRQVMGELTGSNGEVADGQGDAFADLAARFAALDGGMGG